MSDEWFAWAVWQLCRRLGVDDGRARRVLALAAGLYPGKDARGLVSFCVAAGSLRKG